MPKRRFQRGCFQTVKGIAYSFFYEDAEQPDGSVVTRYKRHTIGKVGPDGMSERAARREHDRIMQEVNRKRGSVAPVLKGYTFREAVERWLKEIAPHESPATVRAAKSHLRVHLLPRFGEEALQALDVATLQRFVTDLRVVPSQRTKKPLSRKMVENILGTVFSILEYARRCGTAVPKVSYADLELGTKSSKPEQAFFTQEQATQIIAAAEEPYKTLFTVAWLTGLRAGELLALKVSDLDFAKHTIRVDESADDNNRELRQPKTRNSVALLPMPSALEAVLRGYLDQHWKPNPAKLLFPAPRKQGCPRLRDNVVRCHLKPLLRKLGISDRGAGLHAFRHGLATELAERAVPLPVLQKQLRHADVRTTLRIYAHAIPETQREAMENLAAALPKPAPITTNVSIATKTESQVAAA